LANRRIPSTPPECLPRASFLAVASGVVMLNKTSRHSRLEEAQKRFEEAEKRFAEQAEREHLTWLSRPRLEIGDRNLDELTNTVDLPGERLALFKHLSVAYREEPTIENYVRVRREFPDLEIKVGYFEDPLVILDWKFPGHGIDPVLIGDVLDAKEASIDALSLCLLERLIARGKLPKEGPRHIEERRNAMSETTVNYLISTMLEALDLANDEVRLPASLIVLIREQLSGTNPDLHAEYRLRKKQFKAAFTAALHFYRTKEKISVRKLAAAISVKRSTAARWLADKHFVRDFEYFQQQLLRDGEAVWIGRGYGLE
jgi:hypothetical protein